MERSNFDRDNASQRNPVGQALHTYTPTSHENLIKSQLQLDAANQAKLRNEFRRLQNENDRLRSELDKARKDIESKNNLINVLNNELREKHSVGPKESSIQSYQSPKYEIDGKPLSLQELIDHFNVILQRHHDLLNRKNIEIRDLKDEIDRVKNVPTRDVQTQSSKPNNEELHQKLMNDFTNQIAIIRKEYEQVENILTHRNNKLEHLIEELQRKLDQYSVEIEKLRKELASRETQPSESTIQLLWEKEKENKHLRDLLANIKQTPDNVEIKKNIDDKKDTLDSINEIISEVKKGQPKPDFPDLEKDCQSIISDLTRTNDKLNDVLNKLKDSKAATNDNLNKDDLVFKLESLKKQCQDEINLLNRQLKPTDDKPSYLKDDLPETPKPYFPKRDEKSSGIYPSDNLSQTPSKSTVSFIPKEPSKELLKNKSLGLSMITSSGYSPGLEPHRKHKHSPLEPCEACNDADFFAPQWKESPPPRPVLEPLSSKTSDSQKLIKDFYSPSPRAISREKGRQQKTKSGCCGKKESEFSNYPYEKTTKENNVPQNHSYSSRYDETLVKVYNPPNINENTKNQTNPVTPRRDFNRGPGAVYKPRKIA